MSYEIRSTAREVLGSRKHLAIFLLALLAFGAAFSVTSGLVIPKEGLNAAPDPVLIAMLAALVLLSSLSVAMAAYATHFVARNSVASIAGGLLSSACPYCGPIWLSWIGLAPLAIVVSDYQYVLSLAGLLLVGAAILNSARIISNRGKCMSGLENKGR